jgi:hypothetical protein
MASNIDVPVRGRYRVFASHAADTMVVPVVATLNRAYPGLVHSASSIGFGRPEPQSGPSRHSTRFLLGLRAFQQYRNAAWYFAVIVAGRLRGLPLR